MKMIRSMRLVLLASLVFGAGTGSLYAEDQTTRGQMSIEAIEAGELADIVGISGGLKQGIERGMLLSVFREGRKIGELLVIRSQSDCSAALITEISPNKSLVIGDQATPKIRTL